MHSTEDLSNEQLALAARRLRISALNGDRRAHDDALVLEAALRKRFREPDFDSAVLAATAALPHAPSPAGTPPPTGEVPESRRSLDELLRTMRRLLDMDIAFVAEFVGDRKVFRHVDTTPASSDLLAVGQSGDLAQTYCKRVVDGRFPLAIPDTSKLPETAALPSTAAMKIAAYISVPVVMRDGSVFGTLCCISHTPRSALGNRQIDALRKVAELVSAELEKQRT